MLHPEDKVTIIIPTYNAEKTIVRLISSIQAQTYENLEVLIIDDGSDDSTCNICNLKVGSDSRFIIVKKENGGVSTARNKGIEMATGKYVMFADADDFLPEDCVYKMVYEMQKRHCELVCGSYCMLKSRNRTKNFLNKTCLYDIVLYRNSIYSITSIIPYAPWGKLFLRHIIEQHKIRFPEGIPYGEDGIFVLKYLGVCKSLIMIESIVYYYDFTNCLSAANKYYQNMNKYLRALADERIKTCNMVSGENYRETISSEYCNRCIKYYIIREKQKNELVVRISQTIELFPEAKNIVDNNYYLKSKDYNKYINDWKRLNRKYYIKERMKIKISRIVGRFI